MKYSIIPTFLVILTIKFSVYSQETDTFTDTRDGKEYKTVKIGEQWWMAENLAYLPQEISGCLYSYDEPMYYIYGIDWGIYYNYTAALHACPDGWHLPYNCEWEQLINFISKEKGPFEKNELGEWTQIGTILAKDDPMTDTTSTDDYGFSAIMTGLHVPFGHIEGAPHCFEFFYYFTFLWSQKDSIDDPFNAWEIHITKGTMRKTDGYAEGFNIRCVKD